MQTPRQIEWSVLIFLASMVACASAQTESPVLTENIIAQMASRSTTNYLVRRLLSPLQT
jgi:hypothetical protein